MKHVILPTDFSDNAWKAMSYAANVFHEQPIHFHLLTSISTPVYQLDSGLAVDIQSLLKEAEERLKRLLNKFSELDHHDQTKFSVKAKLGFVVDAIENTINPIKQSEVYVVIGSHGEGSITENIFGTTASAILNKCSVPVYCVSSASELNSPKSLMLALDSHPEAITEKLLQTAELARELDAHLYIVNVSNTVPHYEENSPEWIICEHHFKDLKHSYHSIKGDSIQSGLEDFATSMSVDLIIMVKSKQGIIERIFKKGSTKEMAFHGDKPLLVIK